MSRLALVKRNAKAYPAGRRIQRPGTVALPKMGTADPQRYVKEPTFAKATVGRPASAKTSADAEAMADEPARQALAHLRGF